MIQTDGIYTPWRRKQRAGGDGICPRCGHPQADLEHMTQECPVTVQHAAEEHRMLARTRLSMHKQPRCLWTLGHIPAEWEHELSHGTKQQPGVRDAKSLTTQHIHRKWEQTAEVRTMLQAIMV